MKTNWTDNLENEITEKVGNFTDFRHEIAHSGNKNSNKNTEDTSLKIEKMDFMYEKTFNFLEKKTFISNENIKNSIKNKVLNDFNELLYFIDGKKYNTYAKKYFLNKELKRIFRFWEPNLWEENGNKFLHLSIDPFKMKDEKKCKKENIIKLFKNYLSTYLNEKKCKIEITIKNSLFKFKLENSNKDFQKFACDKSAYDELASLVSEECFTRDELIENIFDSHRIDKNFKLKK